MLLAVESKTSSVRAWTKGRACAVLTRRRRRSRSGGGGSRVLRDRSGRRRREMVKAAYGEWESPITPSFITGSTLALSALHRDEKGNVYWLEGRPKEKGRYVVVARSQTKQEEADVTPSDTNVRTRVHEYGGGAYTLAPAALGGGVIYSNFACQRLFWSGKDGKIDGEQLCLTPESDAMPNGRYRYADGECVRVDGESAYELVCIREDHGANGSANPKDVVNEVVAVALDGSGNTRVLATGKDFYLSPRVSEPETPGGARYLAYICYDHPSMPWDTTELRVTSFTSTSTPPPETCTHKLIDGADGDTSILQPAWHPKSASLYYISDSSGFYNLRRVPPITSLDDTTSGIPILPYNGADFGGSAPGWRLGQSGFVFLHDNVGSVAAHIPDREGGGTMLIVFDEPASGEDAAKKVAESKRSYSGKDGLPYFFGNLVPAADNTLFMLAGGPDQPVSVARWQLGGSAPAEVLKCSSSADMAALAPYISTPTPITFPSPLGESYGYYYPPKNDAFAGDASGPPPLLVKAHGGPTACTSTTFNPGIQFWTSRGFAVLDVDYGGSTGYGREYRRRLRGTWGITDIDDVCAGAQELVRRGLADKDKLAIDGGSAGGFTTLGALAFKDVFTAVRSHRPRLHTCAHARTYIYTDSHSLIL